MANYLPMAMASPYYLLRLPASYYYDDYDDLSLHTATYNTRIHTIDYLLRSRRTTTDYLPAYDDYPPI